MMRGEELPPPRAESPLPPDPEVTTAARPAASPLRTARSIAPDLVAVPEIDLHELERVEDRLPLGELGAAPDPATMPPDERVLHGPVALAAGLVEAQGHRIRLAGIDILHAEANCEHEGERWPCGAHARTAFRGFLRGRALVCTVPRVPSGETLVSACRVGTQDPALWLAEQGWAKAVDSPYADALDAARREGRGMFGPPPGG